MGRRWAALLLACVLLAGSVFCANQTVPTFDFKFPADAFIRKINATEFNQRDQSMTWYFL